MSTALCRVLGSKLGSSLPYHDAWAEGKRGQIQPYSPSPWQGSPQKEPGAAGNGVQSGSRLPPHAMSYLWPPVNVYKAGPASSWPVQRPDPSWLSPGSCFLQGRAVEWSQGGKTRLPAISVTLSSAPLSLQLSPAPLPRSRAQVCWGELLGPRQHAATPASLLTGSSCQAEQGKGIFRAVDLTPSEFPLL